MTVLLQENQHDGRNDQTIEYRRILGGTIRRKSLHDPLDSVFWKVYNSDQNEALIQLCGFHKEVFDQLADEFTPYYNKYTPHAEKIRRVKPTGRKDY